MAFYVLQVENGIWQCVNDSWTKIFKIKLVVHGQYILIRYSAFHFTLTKNGGAAL